MITLIVLTLMLAVGFFNGANDVSKAIATLVGSGVTRYRTAIVWGGLWTFAGAATAAFAAQGLVVAFSGKGLMTTTPAGYGFILAVAIGALTWIWLATVTGLPVSTTHSIMGGLLGAGIVASGFGGIHWAFLLGKFALPLAASPLMSLALIFAVFPLVGVGLARWQGYCFCVQQPAAATCCEDGAMALMAPGGLVVDRTETCIRSPVTAAGVTLADALHWLSAGVTAFARGLNDTPKILGLGVVVSVALGLPSTVSFLLVAIAMAAGSVIGGLKVTATLAQKVTPMSPIEGLTANLVTAFLVIFASRLSLPVSTTHVSSGAIIGLGLKRDARQIRWKTVGEMLLAWVVTVPSAGLVAAAVFFLLQHRL